MADDARTGLSWVIPCALQGGRKKGAFCQIDPARSRSFQIGRRLRRFDGKRPKLFEAVLEARAGAVYIQRPKGPLSKGVLEYPMRIKLSGILPALLTPFTRGGAKVDYEKACAFASSLADRGVDGLFVCGSTGEGLLMTVEERKRLAREVIDAVGKRIKIVIQSGCLDTPSTIELTRHARDAGAFAVAVYTPAFYAYDDRALFGHFRRVAKSAPEVPLLLYNIPQYTGNSLSPALVSELAEKVDSVVGMKDSSGDMVFQSRVLSAVPEGFCVLNGADELTYQAYLTGASGTVAITANVVPELFRSIYTGVKKGNLGAALTAQRRLAEVMGVLGNGRLIATYKEAVRLQGYDVGHVRPPQRELSPAEKKDVAKALAKAGLL